MTIIFCENVSGSAQIDPAELYKELEALHGRIINEDNPKGVRCATEKEIKLIEEALGFRLPEALRFYYAWLGCLDLCPTFLSAKPESTYSLVKAYEAARKSGVPAHFLPLTGDDGNWYVYDLKTTKVGYWFYKAEVISPRDEDQWANIEVFLRYKYPPIDPK